MQAHATLRAIRTALQGHKLGPGPGGSAREKNAALARSEALIERLRVMVEEVDTVIEDPAVSPYADPTELARVRVAAHVASTKVRLQAALKRGTR